MAAADANQLTYLNETLRLQMEQDPEGGFHQWTRLLDEVLSRSDFSAAKSLLLTMKQILAEDSRTPSPMTHVLVWTTEGSILARMGEWAEALAAYGRALKIIRATGDAEDEAWVLSDMGNAHYLMGQYDLALNCFQQALSVYRHSENLRQQARVLANLGSVYRDTGQLTDAQACYEEALLCQQDQPDVVAVALVNLASVLQTQRLDDRAEQIYQAALDLFADLGDVHGQAQVLGNLGTLHLNSGRVEQAVECFLRDLELHQQGGDHASQAQTLNNLAIAYRRLDRLDEASACYERSLFLRRQLGDRRGELTTLINMSILCQEQGNLSTALDCLLQGRAVAEDIGDSTRMQEIELHLAAATQQHNVEAAGR